MSQIFNERIYNKHLQYKNYSSYKNIYTHMYIHTYIYSRDMALCKGIRDYSFYVQRPKNLCKDYKLSIRMEAAVRQPYRF